MHKFSYRKHAIAALSILFVGILAACSGASSSDEALSHPGDLMGTMVFDVNPANQSVTITPVGSPYSATKIPGDGLGNIPNVTVTSSNVSYAANTIDFWVTLRWSDPASDLFNARIGVNFSTDVDVKNLRDDKCKVGAVAQAWSSCLPGNDPAVVWTSDLATDGAETYTITTAGGSSIQGYRNALNAGCGKLSTRWQLNEASGLNYKFWADLYGDKAPINPLLDARYSEDTASIFMRTKKLTYATTNIPPAGAEASNMLPNEWFYVQVSGDQPGNNHAHAYIPPLNYDAQGFENGPKHIEDTGNVAQWAGATNTTANYWYVGLWGYMVRFDNTVVEIASNDGGPAPAGAFKFCTKAVGGTRLQMIVDTNTTTDGWNSTTDAYTAGNGLGFIKVIGNRPASGAALYPNPCNDRALGNICPAGVRDGYANRDLIMGQIPLHVKATAVAGQGSKIWPAFDSNSYFEADHTDLTPYNANDDYGAETKRSFTWPNWCEVTPASGCVTGQYNMERPYICVQ